MHAHRFPRRERRPLIVSRAAAATHGFSGAGNAPSRCSALWGLDDFQFLGTHELTLDKAREPSPPPRARASVRNITAQHAVSVGRNGTFYAHADIPTVGMRTALPLSSFERRDCHQDDAGWKPAILRSPKGFVGIAEV